jgi:hypothetical protein
MLGNIRSVAKIVLAGVLLTALAACSSPAPTPTPTATPSPTPTPQPNAIELRDRAVEAVRKLSTVQFILSHKVGGTDMGGGIILTTVTGKASFPDRATLTAQAVVAALNVNVEIGITQIGPQAFLRDPLSGVWREVDTGSLPFLFAGMNTSVADAMAAATDITLTGSDVLGGVPVYVLTAEMPTEPLRGLVPGALADGRLTVEVRMGQQDSMVRSLRLQGAILAADTHDMVRFLQLSEFNATVTIEPPQ